MKTKVCSKCKIEKDCSEFSKSLRAKDGLQSQCKACDAVYYQENQEEKAIYRRERKEEKATYDEVYRQKNQKKLVAYNQGRKEERAAYHRGRREKTNARLRERRRTDPNFIFSEFCRRQAKRILKGGSKNHSSDEYLGCTREEGRKYIESLWQPGMSWTNHGSGPDKWEIDHIEPLASFDPEDPTAAFWACHISNLQPLWWKDNRSKGDKHVEIFQTFRPINSCASREASQDRTTPIRPR